MRGEGAAAVLCAGVTGDGATQFWTAAAPPLPAGGRALPVAKGESGAADQVYVTPGAGLLVTGPPPAGSAGPMYLVTDQGMRFRLRDRDDAAALGYGDAPPTNVAAGLLELLPSGPELSTEAARQEAK